MDFSCFTSNATFEWCISTNATFRDGASDKLLRIGYGRIQIALENNLELAIVRYRRCTFYYAVHYVGPQGWRKLSGEDFPLIMAMGLSANLFFLFLACGQMIFNPEW